MDPLVFFVNGKKVTEDNPDPHQTLLHYLRDVLHLCGSKAVCGVGGCGACTTMLSSFNSHTKKITHRAVVACLVPVCAVHGHAVTTVEGIGSTRARLHPVQERLAKGHGVQCGFCSPGMVMAVYSLLRSHPHPTQQQIQEAIQGNLCRCTGYRPILEAFNTFTQEFECGLGDQCCRKQKSKQQNKNPSEKAPQWGTPCCYEDYDNTQEPIFPPELMVNSKYTAESVCFRSGDVVWYRPATLGELLKLKTENPEARIVGGNTMIGQAYQKRQSPGSVLIAATHLQELQDIELTKDAVHIGAGVSVQQLKTVLEQCMKELPEQKTRFFKGLINSIQMIYGDQIRNMATVGGCITGGWQPNDLNTALLALGATISTIAHDGKEQCMGLSEDWPLNREDYALLTKLHIQLSSKDDHFFTYKQARRQESDVAQLTGALRFKFCYNSISEAMLGFAGNGLKMMLAQKTSELLVGKKWSLDTVTSAIESLKSEIAASSGTGEYIQDVAAGFCLRFLVMVAQQRALATPPSLCSVELEHNKLTFPRGSQVLSEAPDGEEESSLYRPVPHESAYLSAAGEAVYVDDITPHQDEVYLGLVLSERAVGEVAAVDWQAAMSCPGVLDKVDHTDVPGENLIGIFFPEQEVFISEKVLSEGQIIGGVLAATKAQAKQAAAKVKVTYKTPAPKPVLTIQDAIDQQQFHGDPLTSESGELEAGFSQADRIVEGSVETGAQSHFYTECMACIVYPKERQCFEVQVTSHSLTLCQKQVATALNLPLHNVSCRVKRLGGSFGGKDNEPPFLAAPVAVAAKKLNRPVRCALDQGENMRLFGGREPSRYEYKVGVTADGKITALDVTLYSDVGYTQDVSPAILAYQINQLFAHYKLPSVRVVARMCKTSKHTTTAFRGFGMLQSMLTMEMIMVNISETLDIPVTEIQEKNFLLEGDELANKYKVRNWTLRTCWDKVLQQSQYSQQLEEVQQFNAENLWKKRGLAVVPSSIPVAGPPAFLQTGSALVNIFSDGSVILSHGGVEMGQGIHTKMVQVASHVLGIPSSLILVEESYTHVIPNAPPTIGSMTTDYCGNAIKIACETLLSRLEPFIKNNPEGGWKDWVQAAYFSRIHLSATGFHSNPQITDDNFYMYMVQGASVSLVEVDVLSGQHTTLRTDIVMDVGRSISPAIDLGQIEGAFLMGYGWLTSEEEIHSDEGVLLTTGVQSYKPPSQASVPKRFNVTLLTASGEPRAIYSSKSVGEPPMFMAGSVFLAIRQAIGAARQQSGLTEPFVLHPPATTQKIKELGGLDILQTINMVATQ